MTTSSKRRSPRLLMIAMILCGLVGPGCGSLVATTDIKQSRVRLNEAIRQTTEEQILNAIVETRFGHGPTYLNIAAINAQLAWSASAGGTWSPDGTSSLVPEISYQEQPTILYTPDRRGVRQADHGSGDPGHPAAVSFRGLVDR